MWSRLGRAGAGKAFFFSFAKVDQEGDARSKGLKGSPEVAPRVAPDLLGHTFWAVTIMVRLSSWF